ncbi:MAG: phosphatase PAP2 family protein, partial [Burkholderiaceae bacterium]
LALTLVCARGRVVGWARSRSHLQHRVTLALFDPERSESPTLLVAAVLLVASAWLFLGVLEDVLSGDPLVQFDHAVFSSLQGLRTAWVDGLMVAITEVGSVRVAVPVIGAVALLLAAKRCWRTLAYWFAAVGFAQVLVWALKLSVGRARPSPIYAGIEQYSFPSGHATSAIVLYGFLAFLLARGRSARFKAVVSAMAAGLALLIAFSRLYLGAHWFSDVLAGLSVGLGWVALLAIAYTHHVREDNLRTPALAITSLGVLVLASALQIGTQHDIDVARYGVRPHAMPTLLGHWPEAGWRTLPAYRIELGGDAEEPLALQWAATEPQLLKTLDDVGWRTAPPWTLQSSLLWLLPNPPIEQLPVLSKLNQDVPQKMVLTRTVDAQSRLVLRLWPSGHVVAPRTADHATPLWLGMVSIERLQHPAAVFTIARTDPNFGVAVNELGKDLAGKAPSLVWHEQRGVPLLLVW